MCPAAQYSTSAPKGPMPTTTSLSHASQSHEPTQLGAAITAEPHVRPLSSPPSNERVLEVPHSAKKVPQSYQHKSAGKRAIHAHQRQRGRSHPCQGQPHLKAHPKESRSALLSAGAHAIRVEDVEAKVEALRGRVQLEEEQPACQTRHIRHMSVTYFPP